MWFRRSSNRSAVVLALWWAGTLVLGRGAFAAEGQSELRVTGSVVNVRAQPTTRSDVLFQVRRGEMLALIEEAGTWYLVETPESRRGYIYGELVELVELAAEPETPRDSEPEETITVPPLPTGTFELPSDEESTSVEEAQARSRAERQRKRGLYKMVGGTAGVVAGLSLMGSSKPVGIGLLGAGGFFLWDGFQERREAGRRLEWALMLEIDRDRKAVAYHMSW